nr:hypothetical protein [Tanacetum cinerariifolium]
MNLGLWINLIKDVCRRLCDGGEPRQLWLDEEVSDDGWIRMTAAETGQRLALRLGFGTLFFTRCQLRTSYELPCSHEQAMYLYARQPLPLDVVDAFWKKLDFSLCISLGDNLDCKAELEELNAKFNKQFGLPSTTSVHDPTAKKTTRGRPSGRKTHCRLDLVTHHFQNKQDMNILISFQECFMLSLIGYKMSKLMKIVNFEQQLSGSAFMKMNGPPSDIVYCKS